MTSKRILRVRNRLRFKWWSVENWLKGYKFGPVQRHRCCDHTTPVHSIGCPALGGEAEWDDFEGELRQRGKLT